LGRLTIHLFLAPLPSEHEGRRKDRTDDDAAIETKMTRAILSPGYFL
jgi:hypothetical protein